MKIIPTPGPPKPSVELLICVLSRRCVNVAMLSTAPNAFPIALLRHKHTKWMAWV